MPHGTRNVSPSPDAVEILFHLVDEDLLGLLPGERLWKLYCFRETNHASGLRHRIYTKQKTDGRLELITFASHNPLNTNGDAGGNNRAPAVRSALARVPDLSASDLDRLIDAMRSHVSADECDEIDLTTYPSLDAQLARLKAEANKWK